MRGSDTIPHTRLAEFKAALRELRQRAGDPTYRTMQRRSGVSVATLHGVDAGPTVPTLGATLAYVHACDGDQTLWTAQHRELRRGARSTASFVPWRNYFDAEKAPPPPTVAVLRAEMRRLRINSGMTLQELSTKTTEPHIAEVVGRWGLGATTISDLCNPAHTRVPRRRTLHGFLLAVGAEPSIVEHWLTARNRLEAKRDPHLEPTTGSHDVVAVVPNNGIVRGDLSGSNILINAQGSSDAAAPMSPGELLLARFRRLRADLEPGGATPSPERIQRVLHTIGIPVPTAAELAHQDPDLTSVFVTGIEREFERINATLPPQIGRQPSNSVGFALELAARRMIMVYQASGVRAHEIAGVQRDLQEASLRRDQAVIAHARAASELEASIEAWRRASADLNEAWLRGARIQQRATERSNRAVALRTDESDRTANAWALAVAAQGVWSYIAEEREKQARTAQEKSRQRLQKAELRKARADALLNHARREMNDLVGRPAAVLQQR